MATKQPLSEHERCAFNSHGVTSFWLNQDDYDSFSVFVDTTELYGENSPYYVWAKVPEKPPSEEGLATKLYIAKKGHMSVPKDKSRIIPTGNNLEGLLVDFAGIIPHHPMRGEEFINPVYRDVVYTVSEAEREKYHKTHSLAINPNRLPKGPLNAMTIELGEPLDDDDNPIYAWGKESKGRFPKIILSKNFVNTPTMQPIGEYLSGTTSFEVEFYYATDKVVPYIGARFPDAEMKKKTDNKIFLG